jgi:hypothetical protein
MSVKELTAFRLRREKRIVEFSIAAHPSIDRISHGRRML